MHRNASMNSARTRRADEFYTRMVDIEKGVEPYIKHFKDRVVYCNCDDPAFSNFYKYFNDHFDALGLKKLITTCYRHAQPDMFTPCVSEEPAWVERERGREPVVKRLDGDGDFRSRECVELLKQADIVVTNPPFSLFGQLVPLIMEHDKGCLLVGNLNAVTYQTVLPHVMNNKLWYGEGGRDRGWQFDVPDHYRERGGEGVGMSAVRWYTNLGRPWAGSRELALERTYSSAEYQHYDNYDAINVDKVADIPKDWEGVMGVPKTFLDWYSLHQFQIVGLIASWSGIERKKYHNCRRIGEGPGGNDVLNWNPVLKVDNPPEGWVGYESDGNYYTVPYARILIRNRHPAPRL